MKLTFLAPALAAFVALGLSASTLHAQTTNTAPMATMTPSTKMTKTNYGGAITAIDGSMITVKSKKHTLTLAVDANTKFKNAAALSDFKVGDHVYGSYMKDAAGKMTACSLTKKVAKK